MGRKYRKQSSPMAWLFGILLIAVIVWGFYAFSINAGTDNDAIISEIVTSGGCDIAPTLQYASFDALEKSTSVTTSATYFVNGINRGSTAPSSFSKGDKVQLIVNASDYIDVVTDEIVMDCGSNTVTQDGVEAVYLYDYTAPTIEIKEDNSVITDDAAGGDVNGSAVVAGGTETFEVYFTGTDKDSTGDFLYVVELGTTQNVSKVIMYDSNGNEVPTMDVPSFYTDTLTSPYKVAFKVPAVVGAKEMGYKLTLLAKSEKTIVGAFYTTGYVGEASTDDDGIIYDWTVETDDTADYEATFDEDGFLE